jgi:cache domain-containing protein
MKPEAQENEDISPERIASLTVQLSENMDKVIRDIEQIKEIARINEHVSTSYRSIRLSDIALTNIDLIDRNLYERSCDVRWWATDNSIIDALIQDTPQAYHFASERMGVILDSYTVYFDLVLSNREGEIVTNGRKNQYKSIGANVSDAKWFRDAMTCASGQDYAWETVHHSPLVNNELALVYTTAVRGDRGKENGKIVGALGIIFRYEDLAQTILENVPLSKEEKKRSRLCIVDDNGLVLADSDHKILEDHIDFNGRKELFAEKKGFIIQEYNGKNCCIAHASAPGYETYTTGWHSLIIQET